MAPKRKSRCTSQTCPMDTCNPRRRRCEYDPCQKSVCPPPKPLPPPTCVPRIIAKGGMEVLDIQVGPDAVLTVEAVLQPRMGNNDPTSAWYGFSDPVTVTATPAAPTLPTYSFAKISLPPLNENLTCDTLTLWEAVSLKTSILGISVLISGHTPGTPPADRAPGNLIEGPSFHFYSVSGQPLDLQYCAPVITVQYPETMGRFQNFTGVQQTYDSTYKGVLDKDGHYPVEAWFPDPFKNENGRYFCTLTGGATTPPVLNATNSVSTVLLDERGVGILCRGDGLYLGSADICGYFQTDTVNEKRLRGLARHFSVTLRQRNVRNPYPLNTLLSSLLTAQMPRVSGQPMQGSSSQMEEATITDGTEPLPGDPTLRRTLDARCCQGCPVAVNPLNPPPKDADPTDGA
uniref:Capsid protein VP1 n=1 Tax=STL polyomavirus TaxID=1277649 RepID=A0A060IEA7_9POLY|nr:capsid protein VP1 [STL polyomavirus]